MAACRRGWASRPELAGSPAPRPDASATRAPSSVTDSAQPAETVSQAVEVEVTGGATPLEFTQVLGKQSLVVGTFYDNELPAAAGGVAPHTYAFTCAGGSLPPGMGFAPRTRRLAGTPTDRFRDSCTYSVTDSAQPAETVSQAVEVEVTGGATPLELTQVFETSADNQITLKIGRRSQTEFREGGGRRRAVHLRGGRLYAPRRARVSTAAPASCRGRPTRSTAGQAVPIG